MKSTGILFNYSLNLSHGNFNDTYKFNSTLKGKLDQNT